MLIDVPCSNCQVTLQVPPEVVGKKIRCLQCGEVIRVPSAAPAPAPVFQPLQPMSDPPPPPKPAVRPLPMPPASPAVPPPLPVPAPVAPQPMSEARTTVPAATPRQGGGLSKSSLIGLCVVLPVVCLAGFALNTFVRPILYGETAEGLVANIRDNQAAPRDLARNDQPQAGPLGNDPGGVNPQPPDAGKGQPVDPNFGMREVQPLVIPPADMRTEYDNVVTFAEHVALNFIYLYPPGELELNGMESATIAESTLLLEDLHKVLKPRIVGEVARTASHDFRTIPESYTADTPGFSLAGLFEVAVDEAQDDAFYYTTNRYLEFRHRKYFESLRETLDNIDAGPLSAQPPFDVHIPPIQNRGESTIRAQCLLHNMTNQPLTDIIVRATFHDPWGGSITNHYFFGECEADGKLDLLPGYDWGRHGISQTVRMELRVWSREVSSQPWEQEFPQLLKDSVAQTLQAASERLDQTGDYGPALTMADRAIELLVGEHADPQLVTLANDMKQRAFSLKDRLERLVVWMKEDALFEGRWAFGKHQGPIGAKIVKSTERESRSQLFSSERLNSPAYEVELQIFEPQSPPQYKTLQGQIRFSQNLKEYTFFARSKSNTGLERRPAPGQNYVRIEIDTQQQLLESDDRRFMFFVNDAGHLIGFDTLGGAIHLVPRSSPGAQEEIEDLRASEVPADSHTDWRTMPGVPADLLTRESIRPISGKHSLGEINRFYSVPDGEFAEYKVTPVAFFHKKFAGFSVNGGDRAMFWNFDENRLIGAQQGFWGAIMSPDDKWLSRDFGPNLIGIDKRVAAVPDEEFSVSNFSPDSRTLVAGNENGFISAWTVGGDKRNFVVQMAKEISAVTIDEEKRLFGAALDNQVSVWDLSGKGEPKFLYTYFQHKLPVRQIRISSDGKRAMTIANELLLGGDPSDTGGLVEVHIWDIATQKTLHSFTLGEKPTAYAISPDWKYALVGEGDHYIYLWDLVAGREIARYLGHLDVITSLAFAPGNRFALSGGGDKWVVLWGLPLD